MKNNRSVFLMVALVVIVCVAALVVISSFAWRIIERPVNRVISEISKVIRVNTTDYNFAIPTVNASEQPTPNEQQPTTNDEPDPISLEDSFNASVKDVVADKAYNYNFRVPRRDDSVDASQFRIRDAILDDALVASFASNLGDAQTKIKIQIPSIGVDSPAWQGLGAEDLLLKGFWVYPSSTNPGVGEIAMLCHRRYFGPNDPRTCWYLDKVQKEDPIYMMYEETVLEYRVTDVIVLEANDPEIYNLSATEDSIRIVTCTPLYSDTHRLVVKAERVK